MTLTKRKHSIRFERKVHTTKGLLFMARFTRREIDKNSDPTNGQNCPVNANDKRPREMTLANKNQRSNKVLPEATTTIVKLVMNINKAHQLLGEMCKHLAGKLCIVNLNHVQFVL